MSKNFNLYHKIIATTGGAGYSPFAPGTVGALAAYIVWLPLWLLTSYAVVSWVTIAFIVVFTVLGVDASTRSEAVWGPDPKRVVIDETVGMWITLLAVPPHGHWGYPVAAFVLFRLLDIFKPLGIRRMERLKGGWGIMADDIVAGLYGGALLVVWQLIFLQFVL